MRPFRSTLILATLSIVLAACGPSEPLRLGLLGGPDAAARNGFGLAIEQGRLVGVQGRPLEGIASEPALDAETARARAGELVAAGVAAIVMPADTALVTAVLPIAEAAGIPVVGTMATATALGGRDDHFFRNVPDTAALAGRSMHHLATQHGVRRIALIHRADAGPDTADWLASARQAVAAAGGSLVAEVALAGEDHAAAIDSGLSHAPEALWLITGAADTARLAVRLAERRETQRDGQAPRLLGILPAAGEALIETGGAAVEGIAIAAAFDASDSSPENQAFQKAYSARFGEAPNIAAMAAYDATRVVLQALGRGHSGKPARQALLDHAPYAGVQQPIAFDRNGDLERARIHVVEVREGRFVRAD